MSPAITCVSEHSDSKGKKLEVEEKEEEDTSSDSSSDYDLEEIQNFKEELKRNGGTKLEVVNVVNANHHPGTGHTLYITFEVKYATQLHSKLCELLPSPMGESAVDCAQTLNNARCITHHWRQSFDLAPEEAV
ncbi:unnamed protein product [Arabidopsis arenosa]|uniref:Uncharacterized protein n=1 Tax=Arabidopsis arenosa TaxID=38785 RepID=A0A8S1ZDE9_ARAAE|nr:unnamed protein product [Arabidopsis arenosa]